MRAESDALADEAWAPGLDSTALLVQRGQLASLGDGRAKLACPYFCLTLPSG